MKLLLSIGIPLFLCGSLFSLTANDVANIVKKNQSNLASLCREGGVFRGNSGENCENSSYGYIAFVICHEQFPEFAYSQCAKNVTKDKLEVAEIYNRFQTVFNYVTEGKEAICQALEQGNPKAYSRWCKPPSS